jgi:hypothetical protein
VLQQLQQVFPGHRIKSFGEVNLQEKRWFVLAVESTSQVADEEVVVVYTPCLQKGALRVGD